MQQPTEEDSHHSNHVNDFLMDEHIRGFKSIKSCPRNTILIDNNCVKVCNSDSKYSASDRQLFEVYKHYNKTSNSFLIKFSILLQIWSGVSSVICIVITVFAFLTFMIEPKRFRWPARPILFLTICGFISSSMYLLRWILGSFTCTGKFHIDFFFIFPLLNFIFFDNRWRFNHKTLQLTMRQHSFSDNLL